MERGFQFPFWSMILTSKRKFNGIVSFNNQISLAGKSLTRKEREILIPIHAPYQHFPNFRSKDW